MGTWPGDTGRRVLISDEPHAWRVQSGRNSSENPWVTSSPDVARPPDGTTPARGGSARASPVGSPGACRGRSSTPPRTRRVAVLTALVAAVALAAGFLPEPAGTGVTATIALLWVSTGAVLITRQATRTSRPDAWRRYAVSLVAGVLGAGLVTVLGGFTGPVALGTVPAHLLAVLAMSRMLPAGVRRTSAAGQLVSALMIFVLSVFAILHISYRLVALGPVGAAALSVVELDVLAVALALATGAALAVVANAAPGQRRTAGLLLVTQACGAASSSLAAFAAGTVAAGVACALSVVGIGVLVVACLRDRRQPPAPGRPDDEPSTVATMLPHVTALVAGALLVVTVPFAGFDSAAGVAVLLGLCAAVVHQAAVLRTQRRLTGELRRSEAHFRSLVRSSVDPVIILDEELGVRWASGAVAEMLGREPRGVIGRPITDGLHPDDAPGIVAALRGPPGEEPGKLTVTGRLRHADGGWRLIQTRVRDLRTDPDVGALVLYCRDVTATTRSSARDLPPLATVDPATGLPNRLALVHELGTRLGEDGPPSSLAVVQLSGGAREVLPSVSRHLLSAIRTEEWLACTGPGEFAVLVRGTEADAEAVATRLLECLLPLLPREGRPTVAAGVTELTGVTEAGEALRRAELVLGTSRSTGGGQVWRYPDALRIARFRHDELRADLARALPGGQLRLVFQPIVDLALHRVDKVEALLRWRHPFHGEVSPAEFIPLAEESSLISELGRWVLAQATAAIAAVPAESVGVAVNVSASQFGSGHLVADVLDALEGSGLAATRLTLEVTESVLLEDEHVKADLQALRKLGVRIGIDDFGTGWSSLAYLADLPIDVLKMDRQFLADLTTDGQRRELCRTVLALGDALALDIVVEGVETPSQLRLLRNMGHRYIQGFLFSRPVELEQLGEQVRALDGIRAGIVDGSIGAAAGHP
ncbi:MAG: deubiquitinase [Modestobacter sp.]|nr:deubiquitinase [Modestobacter sp.]